ncbi:hypothetical protein ABID21_004287 [Pseudorhizobium tarimense]|uniref:Uncharacterized protein n=1 Tax=Pseudorhizobium tarimense TaxID=1079109 RepID=A0ABV2HCC7_9HYPH
MTAPDLYLGNRRITRQPDGKLVFGGEGRWSTLWWRWCASIRPHFRPDGRQGKAEPGIDDGNRTRHCPLSPLGSRCNLVMNRYLDEAQDEDASAFSHSSWRRARRCGLM